MGLRKVSGRLTVFYCKDMLGENMEKAERGQYFIGILLYSDAAREDL